MISIIIVNFNSGPTLKECTDKIRELIKTDHEIIVFDNDSSDDSLAAIEGRDITIIRSDQNLGFAKANNEAARFAKGKILHFLNPDVFVNGHLNSVYQRALSEHRLQQIYSTSLVDGSGEPQVSKMLVPRLQNYLLRVFWPSKALYWAIGASVIMPTSVFKTLGGWPQDYFMYTEDLDLFYRAQLRGIGVQYVDTQLTHIGMFSTSTTWSAQERACVIERSFRTFFRKYGFRGEYAVVRGLLLLQQLVKRDPEFLVTLKAAFHRGCSR